MPVTRRAANQDIPVRGTAGRIVVETVVYGDATEEVRELEVQQFEVAPAYVKVRAGTTRSLGAGTFESWRCDVEIMVPCYREEIPETFAVVAAQVADLLGSEEDAYFGAPAEPEPVPEPARQRRGNR